MAALLTSSAALAGALAGFAFGVAGELAGAPFSVPRAVIAAAVVVTVVLDLVVAPVSVRRQVPQLWGRIFSPRSTAVLYGARLGVGPLTILRTWWWWLAVVAAAAAGVWVSVAVGALFGATRILVMLATGTRAGGLRRRERAATAIGVVVAAAAIAAAALLAPTTSRADAAGRTDDAQNDSRSTAPATTHDGDAAAATTTVAPPQIAADPVLESRLPDDVGVGFARIADDSTKALGPIDLAAAARIERDEQAERSLLETRHFLAGHTRAWRHPHGRVAYVAAYRFASPADAEAYRVDGFLTLESRGARAYDLTSPPGARGFSQASSSEGTGEVAHGVAFVRGDLFLLVVETSTSSAATAADAARIATIVDAAARPSSG